MSEKHIEIHVFIKSDGSVGFDIGDVDANARLTTGSYTKGGDGITAIANLLRDIRDDVMTPAPPPEDEVTKPMEPPPVVDLTQAYWRPRRPQG